MEVPPPRRRRGRIILILLIVFLVGMVLFVATSKNPFAQGIQQLAGRSHDQSILDASFTVAAHSFRYYKFSLPQDAANATVVGEFTAQSQSVGNSQAAGEEKTKDSGIEIFILTDASFTAWQRGSAANSIYASGKATTGKVQGGLPAGAGDYYLVFSNKSSPKAAKSVHASVVVRFKG